MGGTSNSEEKKIVVQHTHIHKWVAVFFVEVRYAFYLLVYCIQSGLFICINENVYCNNHNNNIILIGWSMLQEIEPVILVGVVAIIVDFVVPIRWFFFAHFHMHSHTGNTAFALDLFLSVICVGLKPDKRLKKRRVACKARERKKSTKKWKMNDEKRENATVSRH